MEAALDSVRGDAFLWVVEDNVRARRFYEREGWAQDEGSRTSALGPVEVRCGAAVRCDAEPGWGERSLNQRTPPAGARDPRRRQFTVPPPAYPMQRA